MNQDLSLYKSLLTAMARLSGLFSENDAPYIDSRFVEKLYVETTGARDLGRKDKSFDALHSDGSGVGVKTFLGGAGESKREKVAEFTALANSGHFLGLSSEELAHAVSSARNTRVSSDVAEYGVILDSSIYHCLIRIQGGAVIHEEPYRLVEVSELVPTTATGKRAKGWGNLDQGVYFTDGLSDYSYSISKNVLMKRFNFKRDSGFIPLHIEENPFLLLNQLVGRSSNGGSTRGGSNGTKGRSMRETLELSKGVDYVVLPLYSLRDHEVPRRSGINQWNAGGRGRRFGEAYVPIPAAIHSKYPKFFPSRDQPFNLYLPNSPVPQSGKVCQDGGKALMTSPNFELGRWLISVIDPKKSEKDFDRPVVSQTPYSYSDLRAIGKDSVLVRKETRQNRYDFYLEFADLGSFEQFLNDEERVV